MTLTRKVVGCLTTSLVVAAACGCRVPRLASAPPASGGAYYSRTDAGSQKSVDHRNPKRVAGPVGQADHFNVAIAGSEIERSDAGARLLADPAVTVHGAASETWKEASRVPTGNAGTITERIETRMPATESPSRRIVYEGEVERGTDDASRVFAQPEIFESLPIDLTTALQLAGADSWSIKIASERTREARSRFLAARSMWLPSLNFGLGYTHHEGEIQATPGTVINTSRGSLFVGGGAVVSQGPLTGGAGGPARMFMDLSISDAIFEPLFQRQRVKAARSGEDTVFNNVMYSAGSAYFELVRAQLSLNIANRDLADGEDVLAMTESFVGAGKGSPADLSRLRVVVVQRQQVVAEAQAQLAITASELATVLQLDVDKLNPETGLTPIDQIPTTVNLFPIEADLNQLVHQALARRPEVCQLQAEVAAATAHVRGEQWRPFFPSLHVGGSGGGFGGGLGSDIPKLDGRADMDVVVAWQLKNLGLGTAADRRQRASQLSQAEMALAQLKDVVTGEVTQAYHELHARGLQVELAESNIDNASDAMQKTILRIRALEGDPLELIQSLEGLASSRRDFANAAVNFNQAQLKLLRAVGTSAYEQL